MNSSLPTPSMAAEAALPARAVSSHRIPPIDALRSCVTLLVVLQHAALAYVSFAPPAGSFTAADLSWGAFPIVDSSRTKAFELVVLWNDTFFMSLMFLLSGLFVVPSLRRKGVARFLCERWVRLGLPFVVGTLLLAPLAYYPAYLQRANVTPIHGFWAAWRALGTWPAGPMWFLWVLLAFGTGATLLFRFAPGVIERMEDFGAWAARRPAKTALLLVVVMTLAYVGTTRLVNGLIWSGWGPFYIQTARAPLYALYFLFGAALGAHPEAATTLMGRTAPLARRWVAWSSVASAVFVAFLVVLIYTLMNLATSRHPVRLDIATSGMFAITSVVTSFSLLSLFGRFASRENGVTRSLGANAYGIYVIHYGIVIWLQYTLLKSSLGGGAKTSIVIVGGIAISWLITAALRRLPLIRAVM